MKSSSDVIQHNSGPDLRAQAEAAFRATERVYQEAAARDWRLQAIPNSGRPWLLDLMEHEGYGHDDYDRHEAERRAAASASLEADDDQGPELSVKHMALVNALARYARDVRRKRPAASRDAELIEHYRQVRRRKASSMDRWIGARRWAQDGPGGNHTGLI